MLRALTVRAPTAPAPQLEYLLQKVLMLLATMAQRSGAGRSPLQLRAAAATAYHALRTVAACEVTPACLLIVWRARVTRASACPHIDIEFNKEAPG